MSDLRIDTIAIDDALGARFTLVRARAASFETPRRSLSLTASGPSDALIQLDPRSPGLVELYRELSPSLLRSIDKDVARQKKFVDGLAQRVNRLPSREQCVLLVLSVPERGVRLLKDDAEYLADLCNAPFVSAVSVPAVTPRGAAEFLSFSKDFLDAFSRPQGIPLLGFIPQFAYRDIGKVLDFYLKRGIKDFVVDHNGHPATALYPSIQLIRRRLGKAVGEGFYLHGLNVGTGPFRRVDPVSPARDFLGLVSGIDSIGPKHTVKRMPPEVWRRLHAQAPAMRRVFSRAEYGYRSPVSLRRITRGRREEGMISIAQVCSSPTAFSARVFSTEKQGIEAAVVRSRIREGTLPRYVSRKAASRREVEQILRSNASGQQVLDVN